MKYVVILLLLPLFSFAQKNYYLSVTGNDNNNGTSPAAPWQTLEKVNKTQLLPGDSVLFKCGETWTGTLTINSSGRLHHPIVFGKYGTGPNPMISGFITLINWHEEGNGIYSVTDDKFGAFINMVTVNGVNQPIGRYPKANYRPYSVIVGNTSVTDLVLPPALSFTGGEIVIRKKHWIIDRAVVTSQLAGIITYKPEANADNYKPLPANGYFFQNHINCLTQLGDWCYNSSQHKLSMYFGSALPASYKIKAGYYANIISVPAPKSYISFNGIDVSGANEFGILAVSGCSYFDFQKCNFTSIGRDGLNFTTGNYISFRSGSITDCNNNGFFSQNGTNNIVENSVVKNIHTIAGMGQSGDGNGIGIAMAGINPAFSYADSVLNNTVKNIGYCGIYANGNGYLIQNNNIDTFCTNKDDGGGIYTYVGSPAYTYSNRRLIVNNIITNGKSATDGTPLPVASSGHGIYLDDNSSEVTVKGNQVTNCAGAGINANSNQNCSYTDNNISGCGTAGILFAQLRMMDVNADAKPAKLIFTNNTLISKNNTQLLVSFQNQRVGANINSFATWGVFDKNTFIGDCTAPLFFHYNLTDKWPGIAEVFANWQQKIGVEKASHMELPKPSITN